MFDSLIQNYASVNQTETPQGMKWYVAPYPNEKVAQVKLKLNSGKKYDYVCRYPAAENSAAIIGYKYVYGLDADAEECTNTGSFGIVTDWFPSLTVKKKYAVEVDYLFSVDPDEKAISDCVKYLELDVNKKYGFALQFNTGNGIVRPITFFTRTILAAASVLSFPEFAAEESIELAKKAILENRTVDEEMSSLFWRGGIPENIGMDFSDTQVPYETEILLDGEDVTTIDTMNDDLKSIVSSDAVTEHVNKYSHLGAVSIMLRGGFKNLMEAYLSVEPPIADYADEICSRLDGIGNRETFDVLKAYLGK